jgi:glycerol-3-phosphate O-acyltransferase/dihydroxyacetone phosphate acyltransferase
MPGKSAASFKIKEIYSDTEALLSEEFGEPSPLSAGEFQNHWVEFSILGQVDQGLMFEAVQSSLAKGKCLGIFPEGGSHDNTDLLPLKVYLFGRYIAADN